MQVTVQVVETASTPLLAPAERWRGGETGPRPPGEPRPPLGCETPSAGAAVVARSPPRSAGVRRTVRRPHAACPRCPGVPARRAGSSARAPGGVAPHLRLARTAPARLPCVARAPGAWRAGRPWGPTTTAVPSRAATATTRASRSPRATGRAATACLAAGTAARGLGPQVRWSGGRCGHGGSGRQTPS